MKYSYDFTKIIVNGESKVLLRIEITKENKNVNHHYEELLTRLEKRYLYFKKVCLKSTKNVSPTSKLIFNCEKFKISKNGMEILKEVVKKMNLQKKSFDQ